MRVLVATSQGAPAAIVSPVAAALRALDLEVARLDFGRVSAGSGAVGRVVQAILGEVEGRRLERELVTMRPDVAVAFDPGATEVLVSARDRALAAGAHAVPVVAVVPDLAPRAAFACEADRYAVVDDEAAVALADLGVDGARIDVVGAIVPRAFFNAGQEERGAARAAFALPADAPVILVEAAGMGGDTLSQIAVQLALSRKEAFVLFDVGADADVAAQLRRQVPGLGLRAKMFGAQTADAPRLWRTADLVLARPHAGAVHAALAVGAAIAVFDPQGEREVGEAQALVDRGAGVLASRALLLAAVLEPWLQDPQALRQAGAAAAARGRHDGAALVAELVRGVGAERLAVLEETRESARARAAANTKAGAREAAAVARAYAPPSGLEDLSGEDLMGGTETSPVAGSGRPVAGGPAAPRAPGPDPRLLDRLAAELAAREARARRELEQARADAERWEERRALAEARGDGVLAAEAARQADRKRARMHAVLAELAHLAAERARTEAHRSPDVDDMLEALKRRATRTLDDELAELKKKMEQDKRGKR